MAVSGFAGYSLGAQMLNTVNMQMDVVGQNIANASTPGYSQQTAVVQQAPPIYSGGDILLGGGSEVTSIQRQADPYVDAQVVATSGGLGAASTLATGLGQLESLINESNGQGLTSNLDSLTSAFTALSANPSDPSLQQSAVSAAQTLASDVNQRYVQLTALQQQADGQARQGVSQLNSTAAQVASLNTQIADALAAGQSPNELEDQRQQDLVQLGTLAGVQTAEMSNGMINVSVSGHWLVEQGASATVAAAPLASNPALTSFTWADNGQAFTPTGGSIQGALELRDTDVGGAITNLNNLANAVRTDYNAVQASGYPAGSATLSANPLFTGTGASDLAVSAALVASPSLLATAQTPSAPGDGSNAAAFAALGTAASPELGMGYAQALANWTTEAGASAALATQQQTTQQANLTQLNNLRSSISGVDLNGQAVQLSEYEQAYQAGAKYIGTLDTMMQTLFTDLAYA